MVSQRDTPTAQRPHMPLRPDDRWKWCMPSPSWSLLMRAVSLMHTRRVSLERNSVALLRWHTRTAVCERLETLHCVPVPCAPHGCALAPAAPPPPAPRRTTSCTIQFPEGPAGAPCGRAYWGGWRPGGRGGAGLSAGACT